MAKCVWLCVLLMVSALLPAAQLRVAVASNFAPTLEQLATEFQHQSGHQLQISSASTGQLYAQIRQGAPFDLFLAADTKRPERLVADGLASEPHVYARGQLTLVVLRTDPAACAQWLAQSTEGYLAIANPDLAPYGTAARSYLQETQLWQRFSGRLVMGENIAQATHLVFSGNARAGLLANALLSQREPPAGSCQWPLPVSDYPPVLQVMVTLNRGAANPVTGAFRRFLRSQTALQIISQHGYLTEQDLD